MYLKNLYLHQFRNYKEIFFDFCPNINLICGPNAQGKTSVLEAVAFLMAGRSFRTSLTSEMISQGASAFYIESDFIKHDISQKLKITSTVQDKKIVYNSTNLYSLSCLLGIIQGVVMSPDDIDLIKGAPQNRRHFLDLQIAQADPLYVHHLTRYHRAMRQRNHMLKAQQLVTIESWEHEMASSAAYLTQKRALTANELQARSNPIHQALTHGSETLNISFKTGIKVLQSVPDLKKEFLEMWRRHRQRELILGYTLSGPHKDDLIIEINQKEAKNFASEGQQRICATSLRFAEWEILSSLSDEPPILLLDDIGLGLDSRRRSLLFSFLLATKKQVFLSSTDESLLDQYTGEKIVISL